jgi:NAD(P)-dependent dehydrogenase (short-subunit alcohol dehydrogenase family)
MSNIRFDGRTAVVTGAARGIGRGYALLLGQRGAKVVVNDLGGSTKGTGHDPGPAQEVADEINKAGGTAIANSSDVSTVEGGKAAVDAGVDEWGRVDIVVNNAGNVIYGALPELDMSVFDAIMAVHLRGTFNVTRAAWPHMEAQNYGRILLTGSTGMFGLYDNLSYATAKAGMIGMAQAMTVNAGEHDIKINVICPNAWTRMAGDPSKGMDELRADRPAGAPPNLEPELVAPMVAFLAHESCPVSAGIYTAGGGRFARLFVGATDGYLLPGVTDQGAVPTPEDVAANWAAINDEASYYVPQSTLGWSARYMSHLFGKDAAHE